VTSQFCLNKDANWLTSCNEQNQGSSHWSFTCFFAFLTINKLEGVLSKVSAWSSK